MKKLMKYLFTILMAVILLVNSTLNVYAATATPAFGGSYVNGVGNITIYLDYSSGVGYREYYIKNAANNWMYPGSGMSNPIHTQFVSSNSASNIDFYAKSGSWFVNKTGSYDVLALTEHFRKGKKVEASFTSTAQWTYANIYINDDNFRKSSFTNEMAKGTVIHEMGHAFGLAHNNTNINSVMCQSGFGRVAQSVQQVDNDAINRKYR